MSSSNSSKDTVRQIVVAVSAVLALIGAFVGSGAAGGTPIQSAAGGALSASATPIAPATPAFSIWSVIYLGLIVYAIWQFFPRQRTAERHRRLGYWVAASLLLNAAWILSIQLDVLWLSLPIIVALLIVLVRMLWLCLAHRPSGWVDAVITDGTIGLYLGWVCVATAADAAAVLVAAGFRGFGLSAAVWALVVLAIAGLVGILLAIRDRGRIAPMLSLAWGLAWVAVGRLADAPHSVAAGTAAVVAAAAVIVVTVIIRVTRGSAKALAK